MSNHPYPVFDLDGKLIGLLQIPKAAYDQLVDKRAGEKITVSVVEPMASELAEVTLDWDLRTFSYEIYVNEWTYDEHGNRMHPVSLIGEPRYIIEYQLAIQNEKTARETYDIDPVERHYIAWMKYHDTMIRMRKELRGQGQSMRLDSDYLSPLPKRTLSPEERARLIYPYIKALSYDRVYVESLITETIKQALDDRGFTQEDRDGD